MNKLKVVQLVKRISCAFVATSAFFFAGSTYAGVIFTPQNAVINFGGPGFGNINDTINQNGLSAGYTSGVTDFDTYISSGPTHTTVFSGFEWFSDQGSTSASVTYDFGSVMSFDTLALWNEESSGIGLLDLFTSVDGITFTSLAVGLTPTVNLNADYSAELFSFATTTAQFIRFDMSACPNGSGDFDACALAEVAFRSAVKSAIPEPETFALMLTGLLWLGAVRRKRNS